LGSRCTCSAVLVFGELAEALRTALGLSTKLNGIKVQELEKTSGAVLVTIPVEVEGGTLKCEKECKKLSDAISMAILLGTRAAGRVASTSCACVSISETGEHRTIAVSETIKVSLNARVYKIRLASWRDIAQAAEKIHGLTRAGGRAERIVRFLKLYRDAMLEEDPVDKFFDMWRAFENWYKCEQCEQLVRQPDKQCGELEKGGGEKQAAVAALARICGVDEDRAEKIYELRSALFHEGVDSIEGMSLSEALGILSNCLDTIARGLWENLTGAAVQPSQR